MAKPEIAAKTKKTATESRNGSVTKTSQSKQPERHATFVEQQRLCLTGNKANSGGCFNASANFHKLKFLLKF